MSYQRCFYNYTYTEKYKLVLTVSPRFCPRVKQMNQLASYTKLKGVAHPTTENIEGKFKESILVCYVSGCNAI
jgi:hypothetical protein